MSFWEIVIDELDYQNKTRKWLAAEVSIDVSTIGTGLKRGSIPQVDLAIKIANALNVPVEYLLTGIVKPSSNANVEIDIHKYHKYSKVINNLDSLPERERNPIIKLIEELSKFNQND